MGPKIKSEQKGARNWKNLIEAAAANGPRIEKCSHLTWGQICDFIFENKFIKKGDITDIISGINYAAQYIIINYRL